MNISIKPGFNKTMTPEVAFLAPQTELGSNPLVSFKSVYISFFARKLGNILDH